MTRKLNLVEGVKIIRNEKPDALERIKGKTKVKKICKYFDCITIYILTIYRLTIYKLTIYRLDSYL